MKQPRKTHETSPWFIKRSLPGIAIVRSKKTKIECSWINITKFLEIRAREHAKPAVVCIARDITSLTAYENY